jgi:hypothetical protein
MELRERVDKLSEREVEACLQGVLKGFVDRNPEYGKLVGSSTELGNLAATVADQLGEPLDRNAATAKDSQSIRRSLQQLAADAETGPWVEAWLDGNRPTLLEPITTALVLGSLVMILSTHLKVDVETKDGKTHVKVQIEKKPTATTILRKFFKLF